MLGGVAVKASRWWVGGRVGSCLRLETPAQDFRDRPLGFCVIGDLSGAVYTLSGVLSEGRVAVYTFLLLFTPSAPSSQPTPTHLLHELQMAAP